jgi:hypothetical protein
MHVQVQQVLVEMSSGLQPIIFASTTRYLAGAHKSGNLHGSCW